MSGIYVWTILTEIFTVMTLFTVLVCFCPKTLMSEPEEIATMTGQKIPRKCSIGKLYRFEITYQTGVRVFQYDIQQPRCKLNEQGAAESSSVDVNQYVMTLSSE